MAHHQNDWSLARSFNPKTAIPIIEWPPSSWSDCQSAVSSIGASRAMAVLLRWGLFMACAVQNRPVLPVRSVEE
jgi:hypothetical protein